ncbi:MAG: 2OG-Fe(II) oxygenase [Gammaproteobacteria bacterium]|nr:2OG-Fe(II) oxygenase [Gammaproteobacteria bacterium]
MDLYTRIFSQSCFDVNKKVLEKFESLTDDDFKEKTHLFNGRYENIYLEIKKIPGLEIIVNAALENSAKILNIKKEKLVSGFWLNSMAAGDVTTAHTHDDDDELLSCVYYIRVPENSGNLIITADNEKTTIKPEEGMFVFFSPDTLHEVSKNKSTESRLSIAFNFGLVRT